MTNLKEIKKAYLQVHISKERFGTFQHFRVVWLTNAELKSSSRIYPNFRFKYFELKEIKI